MGLALKRDDQTDPRHHRILNLGSKTLFFHPVGPFRIAKRPFLGPRFLGTLSRVCVHELKIIRT